uniref:REC114 meiotic recombination protein n=1 Tax=Jaculus jaculus TaxID=51337 RepID=A0A8C5NWG6_JACJA
KDCLLFGIIK